MSNITFPILKTKRLLLRKLTVNDAQQIFYLRSDKIVNQFILRPKQKDYNEALTFIKDRNNDIKNGKIFYWVISLKEEDELIGTICLWNFSENNSVSEIGYDLRPEYFNKGIMTEAIKTIIDFGFETLNLSSIEAFTHTENTNSIKLLEGNKFVFQSKRKDEGFPLNKIFELKNPN